MASPNSPLKSISPALLDLLHDDLDCQLPAAQQVQLEQRLAADPAAAALLARLKNQRALRQAAFQSFNPSPDEAKNFAARTMEACNQHAPVGYVGVQVRWAIGVAAALALVVGSFAMGRVSATGAPNPGAQPAPSAKTDTPVIYRVVYVADSGEKEVREFATLDEVNEFVGRLDVKHAEPQVASIDLSHAGSF